MYCCVVIEIFVSFLSLAHATMIGSESKKVLGYANDNKNCRICEYAEKLGLKPRKHDCRRNWQGSSKAMEPHMVVNIVKKINDSGKCRVSTLIGDDDTSTISHIHQEVDPSVDKRSDKNHVKKNLGKLILELSKKYPKILTRLVILYFQKLFAYMVSQNKGNPENIKRGLKAIVNHAFGDHQHCDQEWCGFLKNPSDYKHKGLPWGKDLTDPALKEDLHKLFGAYEAVADKLADLRSTQANESLNMLIHRRAPKFLTYSGSPALAWRIAGPIGVYNEGYVFVPDVSLHLVCTAIRLQV